MNHHIANPQLDQLAMQAVTKRTRLIATVDLFGQGQLGSDPGQEFGGREFLRRLGRAVVQNPHDNDALGVNVQAQFEGLGLVARGLLRVNFGVINSLFVHMLVGVANFWLARQQLMSSPGSSRAFPRRTHFRQVPGVRLS